MPKVGFYAALSPGYAELYGEEQGKKLDWIKTHLPLEGLTLDVGCGPGLAKEFFRTIGLDPCLEVLHPGDVCGVAEWLPFKEKSVDNILCTTVIHHCDLSKALAEMQRVAQAWIVVSLLKRAREASMKRASLLEAGFTAYKHDKDWIFAKKLEG